MSITDKDFTELSVKVESINKRSESNGHRINDLENEVKDVKDIQITLVKMANGIENMGNEIKEVRLGQEKLSEKVNEIENRPANEAKAFLDTITGKIISVVAGGLIFYILGTMFPMIPWR